MKIRILRFCATWERAITIALGILTIIATTAFGILQYASGDAKPALTATATVDPFSMPPLEALTERGKRLRNCTQCATITIKDEAGAKAREVRVPFCKGSFFYSIDGEDKLRDSERSTALVGDLDVSQSTVVKIWGDSSLDTNAITVACEGKTIKVCPLRKTYFWAVLWSVVGTLIISGSLLAIYVRLALSRNGGTVETVG